MKQYRVTKTFVDYTGRTHPKGELATEYNGCTYGVLAENEIPLVYPDSKAFMGTKVDNVELVGENVEKNVKRVWIVAGGGNRSVMLNPPQDATIVGSFVLADYQEFITKLTDDILEQSDGGDDIVWAINHVLKEYL